MTQPRSHSHVDAPASASAPADLPALPLFPLQTVLFPGGLLGLKVFEARYLDLMGHCLRTGEPFGVVCLSRGQEVQPPSSDSLHQEEPQIERCATLARLDEVDAEQAGILQIRCIGTQRVKLDQPWQEASGLWRADAWRVADDDIMAPPEALQATVQALGEAIASMREQGIEPFTLPHDMNNAGWVSNRWCEILPISLAAKQRLMELEDPLIRLRLVDEFLRNKGVVKSLKRGKDQ